MKTIYTLLLLAMLAHGCSAVPSDEDIKEEQQQRLVEKVRSRSAQAEFEERLEDGRLVFYSIGSEMYGYAVPGLSEEQVELYVNSKKVPVVVEYVDDPAPVFATEIYWKEVDHFLEEYNRLVLKKVSKE